MSITAGENMNKSVVCIGSETSLKIAWDIMKEADFKHIPIVDDKRLVGVLSDRDILVLDPKTKILPHKVVADIMSRDLVTCDVATPIHKIASTMLENKIHCMPVLEGDELVGMITSSDLMELIASGIISDQDPIPWKYQVSHM